MDSVYFTAFWSQLSIPHEFFLWKQIENVGNFRGKSLKLISISQESYNEQVYFLVILIQCQKLMMHQRFRKANAFFADIIAKNLAESVGKVI